MKSFKFRASGVIWTVKYVSASHPKLNQEGEEFYGYCDHDECCVYICKDLVPTLIHVVEGTHCFHYGEKNVGRLETGLFAIFTDNGIIRKELFG
jgi:hypothetical protein